MELSYISGKGHPKKHPIFEEVTFRVKKKQQQKNKKNTLKKLFIFRETELSSLKKLNKTF